MTVTRRCSPCDFLSVSSDDDLTPYDMSCDQELSKATPPRYLSDCMDGIRALIHPRICFQYFQYVAYSYFTTRCDANPVDYTNLTVGTTLWVQHWTVPTYQLVQSSVDMKEEGGLDVRF